MKKLIRYVFALLTLVVIAFNLNAQVPKQTNSKPTVATIEVIQFHSEHRCVTCLKIEKLTRATLAKHFSSIPFKLVNVDEKKNEKIAEEFQATGTALFLYNPTTGKKKDLTDFAFMKAGDEKAFEIALTKYIQDFLKL